MQNTAIQQLVHDLGLDKLPENEKNDMIFQISNIVFSSVLGRCSSQMSDEQNQELKSMMDAGKQGEEIEAFLRNAVPAYDQITAEEFTAYKEFVLKTMSGASADNSQDQTI